MAGAVLGDFHTSGGCGCGVAELYALAGVFGLWGVCVGVGSLSVVLCGGVEGEGVL